MYLELLFKNQGFVSAFAILADMTIGKRKNTNTLAEKIQRYCEGSMDYIKF
jgi:hypothetical protein